MFRHFLESACEQIAGKGPLEAEGPQMLGSTESKAVP